MNTFSKHNRKLFLMQGKRYEDDSGLYGHKANIKAYKNIKDVLEQKIETANKLKNEKELANEILDIKYYDTYTSVADKKDRDSRLKELAEKLGVDVDVLSILLKESAHNIKMSPQSWEDS